MSDGEPAATEIAVLEGLNFPKNIAFRSAPSLQYKTASRTVQPALQHTHNGNHHF